MDALVEEVVRSCQWCQSTGGPDPPAPVITEEQTTSPWEKASLDFGSLPDGRHMMVLVDDFSKYPEIEIINNLTSKEVIIRLEKMLATHGLIKELRTDNGPPFQSQDLADYLKSWRIQHRKITPRWPQANGEAERFMQTLNKVIRIAHAAETSVEGAIYAFLREYRQTPHTTTGQAPGHAAFGRVGAESIPHHNSWVPQSINDQQVRQRRQLVNDNASRKRRAKVSEIKEGDRVLLKDRHPGSKFRLPFEIRPWTVINRKGLMVTGRQGEETITRNVSHFKQFRESTPTNNERDSSSENWPDMIHSPSGDSNGSRTGDLEQSQINGSRGEGVPTTSPKSPPTTTPTTSRGNQSRYHLRENPGPSSRLRDYALWCGTSKHCRRRTV